jgi:hypothetical protein
MKPFTDSAARALQRCRQLIDRVGPRPAGSQAAHSCAAALGDLLPSTSGFSVGYHDFKVHPRAFHGFIHFLVASTLSAVVLHTVGLPLAASVLLLVTLPVVLIEFVFYGEVMDPFFASATGRNVEASLEPTGPAEREILVTGHHDSAPVFRFLAHGFRFYSPVCWAGLLTFAVATALSAVHVVLLLAGHPFAHLFEAALAFIVPLCALASVPFLFFFSRAYTPGAGDNLIASLLAAEVVQHFAEPQRRLARTRLRFVSFDAEESGLRGSRAWVRDRLPQLPALPRVVLNTDSVFDARQLKVMTRDLNGLVTLDAALARRLGVVAQDLGLKLEAFPLWFGGGATDAAEFQRKGVTAASILAMDTNPLGAHTLYHRPDDIPENLDPEAVRAIIEIYCTYIHQSDQA